MAGKLHVYFWVSFFLVSVSSSILCFHIDQTLQFTTCRKWNGLYTFWWWRFIFRFSKLLALQLQENDFENITIKCLWFWIVWKFPTKILHWFFHSNENMLKSELKLLECWFLGDKLFSKITSTQNIHTNTHTHWSNIQFSCRTLAVSFSARYHTFCLVDFHCLWFNCWDKFVINVLLISALQHVVVCHQLGFLINNSMFCFFFIYMCVIRFCECTGFSSSRNQAVVNIVRIFYDFHNMKINPW